MNITQFRELLSRHQKQPPIQVAPLAKEMGLKLYNVSGWSDDVSGRIYRINEPGKNPEYAIDVNANHPPVRRRFTIAHELAHFVLHREQIGHEMYDDHMYRSGLPDRLEWQANALAADILMPRKLIQKCISEGQTSPSELAMKFNVSERAMEIRLENL